MKQVSQTVFSPKSYFLSNLNIIFWHSAVVAIVASSPLDKKDKNPAFGKCANICNDDFSNQPICATDGNKLTLSFANECALKKYNCEHNKSK